jgi:hypothetical protein
MLKRLLTCYRVERIVCKLLIDIVMQTRHSIPRLGVLDRRRQRLIETEKLWVLRPGGDNS